MTREARDACHTCAQQLHCRCARQLAALGLLVMTCDAAVLCFVRLAPTRRVCSSGKQLGTSVQTLAYESARPSCGKSGNVTMPKRRWRSSPSALRARSSITPSSHAARPRSHRYRRYGEARTAGARMHARPRSHRQRRHEKARTRSWARWTTGCPYARTPPLAHHIGSEARGCGVLLYYYIVHATVVAACTASLMSSVSVNTCRATRSSITA